MTVPIRLAVTGNPVLHSKSPIIFNTFFRHLSVKGYYGRLAASSAAEALELFNRLDLQGMSVTAPFKQDIMPLLDEVEDAAARIGGVNTVVRTPKGIKGYNTDHTGVALSLRNRGVSPGGKRCVVLGAGGAGRAAVFALVKNEAEVTLVNRTYEKAHQVARDLGCAFEPIGRLPELLAETDIFVSTLSSTIDLVPAQWLHPGLTVFDANYKTSALIEKAEAGGCLVIKGEEWLLNQALPAYGYFLGEEPRDEGVLEAVRRALRTPARSRPANIALTGFMGSGKSAVGEALAQRLGMEFVDLDLLLEEKAGESIPDIFKSKGETFFRSWEKRILQEELSKDRGAVYACGGGAVLDAANRKVLKDHALAIWLYASIGSTLERIPRGTRPLLDVADPAKEANEILTHRLNHYARSADLVVSSEPPVADVVEKIHGEISQTFGN